MVYYVAGVAPDNHCGHWHRTELAAIKCLRSIIRLAHSEGYDNKPIDPEAHIGPDDWGLYEMVTPKRIDPKV